MEPPSVEAKISVPSRSERPSESARESSSAVAAALVAAPGPSAESRWAITSRVRSELPGSVRTMFRRVTSSPSWLASKSCTATSPPSIAEKRSRTRSPTSSSPAEPGSRSAASSTIVRALRAASVPSKVGDAIGAGRAGGTGSSENMSSTKAATAGRSAAR